MAGKKTEVKSKYEASAGVYDFRYENIQNQKYVAALEGLELKYPVLDLGCGTGLLADFLKQKIFGCDISFEMLKKAKTRGETVVRADLDYLPFKNYVFAAVLSFTSLQNLPAVEKALEEIKRISKPNATVVLTYLKKFEFSNEIKKEFEILEARDLGEDVGFVIRN